MPKLHLISLGCTKNLVDSEVMLARLKRYEMTQDIRQADLIVVNTCGFIEAAKTESIEAIIGAARLKKKEALLVVSGCLT
ncbi:MAG: 30S ribosomal protein S12 methylthiotransferase RimO, partial [Helicobacteraceae bacterium]|nr:30S ribosomal protein S12 methylthiotransferase RimO [Helicobacteraceae bacterium]